LRRERGRRDIHHIEDAKRAIIEKLDRGGRVDRSRLYAGAQYPASLITGAIARLESDREIKRDVGSDGREYYERCKPSTVKKVLRLLKK